MTPVLATIHTLRGYTQCRQLGNPSQRRNREHDRGTSSVEHQGNRIGPGRPQRPEMVSAYCGVAQAKKKLWSA
jgi:hypothetical protein